MWHTYLLELTQHYIKTLHIDPNKMAFGNETKQYYDNIERQKKEDGTWVVEE